MRRSAKLVRLTSFCLSIAIFLPLALRAQVQSGTAAASFGPALRTNEKQSNTPQITNNQIRIRVNEVVLPVTITNEKGKLVLDLAQKDFRIFDNGAEQTIRTWSFEPEPLSLALVIETSSHVQSLMPLIHKNAIVFTEQVMALESEAAVVTYDSDVNVLQPFTQDHRAVEKSIAQAGSSASGIKLYDGMAEAEVLLEAQPANRRRIMLVIGESQDYGSEAKLGQLMREAQRSNISIYSIGLSSTDAELKGGNDAPLLLGKDAPPISATPPASDGRYGTPYDWLTPTLWLVTRATNQIANHRLATTVAATGGIHYSAPTAANMSSALDKIGAELRSQYILTYVPDTDHAPGFNEVRVTVSRPHLTVRTRPGYFVPRPDLLHATP
jgi:VWFA-related protein